MLLFWKLTVHCQDNTRSLIKRLSCSHKVRALSEHHPKDIWVSTAPWPLHTGDAEGSEKGRQDEEAIPREMPVGSEGGCQGDTTREKRGRAWRSEEECSKGQSCAQPQKEHEAGASHSCSSLRSAVTASHHPSRTPPKIQGFGLPTVARQRHQQGRSSSTT